MACAAAAPSPCRAPARVLRQHAEPAQVPAHPPHTPTPRRPSLWGGKLCRRLLILILRRRLQAWSPRKQSPCGSSATQTSRAPRPSAAHDSSPCVPAAWAGPIVSCAPSGMRRPTSPRPSRPASLRSYRTTSPPLSSGRQGHSRRTSCPTAAAAAAATAAGYRQEQLAPALHLRRWSSTTKYHCRTTLLPTFSRRPPSGAPPSPPPPPPRTPRRVMHRCLPPPSGTRCTCT